MTGPIQEIGRLRGAALNNPATTLALDIDAVLAHVEKLERNAQVLETVIEWLKYIQTAAANQRRETVEMTAQAVLEWLEEAIK